MSIKESALSAITSITQSDFIRAVTSAGASRRLTVANLAKAIIESYTGSSLGGANQSVKAAIDLQHNKLPETSMSSGSIDDVVKTGIYYVGNAVTGKPNGITGAGTGGMLIVMYVNETNYVKIFVRNTDISDHFAYVRRVNGGTDMGWALIK